MDIFGNKRIAVLESQLQDRNDQLSVIKASCKAVGYIYSHPRWDSVLSGKYQSVNQFIDEKFRLIDDLKLERNKLIDKEAERKKKKKRKAGRKVQKKYDAEYKQLSAAIEVGDKFTYCDDIFWCVRIGGKGRPLLLTNKTAFFTVDDLPLIKVVE